MLNVDELMKVDHQELHELLLDIGSIQSPLIWGPPGIGKTEGIKRFADELRMHFVVLLGSMMNPEDLMVPLIDPKTGTTRYCPPDLIFGREFAGQPMVLLLDEINGADPDVTRGFYPLVNEHRLGSLYLPQGSMVVGAANPVSTNSVARPLPAPLMNRFYHVQLKLKNTDSWLAWASEPGRNLHPIVLDYIRDQGVKRLTGRPGGDDEVATSPRSWAALGRVLRTRVVNVDDHVERVMQGGLTPSKFQLHVAAAARGAVSAEDAEHFARWWAMKLHQIDLRKVLDGSLPFPTDLEQAAVASALIDQLGRLLGAQLPALEHDSGDGERKLARQAWRLLEQIGPGMPEMVRALLANPEVPGWFADGLMHNTSKAVN